MWLHARKMKRRWFLKKSEQSSFLSFKKSFLTYAMYDEFGPKKQGESAWKYPSLLFCDVKTSKESNDMILVTIRCLYVATCQENEEKSDFWKKILQWRWYNTCNISYVASFLEWDIGGNYVEMISIAFLWCKNIQGIEWYASHDHTMRQFTYKSPKGWKSGFFFKFWCVFGVIFDNPENFEEFFSRPKKTGGNLSKI